MKIDRIPKSVLLLSLCLSLNACFPRAEEETTTEETTIINPKLDFRPNILWLVAEDQSPNLPAFGDSTVITPTLNALAAEGVCYDNFYTAHPVCAPARASIITGMYANSIGASHMRTGPWYNDAISPEAMANAMKSFPQGLIPYEAVPPPDIKMFTEYLRAAGYYCTNNNKQDYQFKKTMTAWDENSGKAHWRNRAPGQAFFSVFNFEVTHESRIWSKAEDSLWVDEDLDVPVPPYLPDTQIGRRDVRRMYSNLLEMDHQVGQVLTQLKADGLLDSTIVIWYSDHGGPLPRQKRLLYDSGIKVPLIIRFPNGQFAGMRDDRMISFIDLAPTVMSLAGMRPKDYMDGKAFLGEYLRDEEPPYVFGAADRFDAMYDRIRSVRDKRFKYLRYYMPEKPMYLDVAYRRQQPIMQELLQLRDEGKLTPEQALWFRKTKPQEELFDLQNDPHELNNLADDPAYAEKLEELRQACNNWVESINDTGMRPEKELLESLWPGQIQPATAEPVIEKAAAQISITCATVAASIGYKVIRPGDDPEAMSWSIYTAPFTVPDDAKVIAIAHRIGYKRSKPVNL
jgi:arylsulfatase A-like enzyme